jgi:hypothetical protein
MRGSGLGGRADAVPVLGDGLSGDEEVEREHPASDTIPSARDIGTIFVNTMQGSFVGAVGKGPCTEWRLRTERKRSFTGLGYQGEGVAESKEASIRSIRVISLD